MTARGGAGRAVALAICLAAGAFAAEVRIVEPGGSATRKKGTAVLTDESGRTYEIEGRSPPASAPAAAPQGTLSDRKKRAYTLLWTPIVLGILAILWLRRRWLS